jgi:hypothetical protein
MDYSEPQSRSIDDHDIMNMTASQLAKLYPSGEDCVGDSKLRAAVHRLATLQIVTDNRLGEIEARLARLESSR